MGDKIAGYGLAVGFAISSLFFAVASWRLPWSSGPDIVGHVALLIIFVECMFMAWMCFDETRG